MKDFGGNISNFDLDFDTSLSDKHLMHLDFLKVVTNDLIDFC